MSTDTHRTIEVTWRRESARIIASLARIVRDVDVAEELAHDALVAALEQWPLDGIPVNPAAWLTGTAKHRAIDYLRRNKLLERKHNVLGQEMLAKERIVPDLAAAADDDIGDGLLRLIFFACNPVLSPESRVALTLRLLGGLSTQEIARAFFVPESTIAQRIVRAKRTLAEKQVPFEIPRALELSSRLESVLEVVYLIFNEGYAASSGDDWLRPSLCDDALRLGRLLADLVPNEPEVHGLVALMEIQASRFRTRVGDDGEAVLLLDQDRSRWDWSLIERGLGSLAHAESLGAVRGPYVLQANIAACHARARTAEQTDWTRIAELYAELRQAVPSPVVELGRAVAVGMAFGPAAGLELADALADEPPLQNSHRLPSVRADLLFRLGRIEEARVEFARAASLTENAAERRLLLERARCCSSDA